MPNGKIFAAEFALRRNVSALDKLLIEDSEDGVVKYAYPPQVSALSGYAYAESIADLPDNPANKTIAYVVGRMLYIYVGEGGDAKNGEYQSVDFLVGPPGIPGEKGDKGDPADGSIDEAYLANYLQQNQYQTAADVNSKLALYATKQYVKDEINELLGGASSAFDTLKEIEDVLAGNVDSIGDLFAVLDTKWTQDNTLIAHWNEAYSWGNHALAGYLTQADASDFVTVTEAQTITGAKNFTGGLQVNGSAIVYNSALGVWQLTGDLLVTGGISMYSSIEGFVPSTITDAVLIDNQTIKRNSVGALYAVAAGLDESQLAAYLTTNNYAKKSDITTALVPYALATSIPTNNNQLTNGAGYITGITSSMVTAALGYTPLSTTGTAANANKLGGLPPIYRKGEGCIPTITSAGVMEIGKYIDFHTVDDEDGVDYSLRIGCQGTHRNRVYFPTNSGTLALTSDIPSLAGYATQSWVNTALAGYLPLSGGTMSGALNMNAYFQLGNNKPITACDTDGVYQTVLYLSTANNLIIGYGTSVVGKRKTVLLGNRIEFKSAGNENNTLVLDTDRTASFVSSVTATSFIGNLTGNADSATKAKSLSYDTVTDLNNVTQGTIFKSSADAANRPSNTTYITGIALATNSDPKYRLILGFDYFGQVFTRVEKGGVWDSWSKLARTSDNVASATKLATPRTIWGQSFDGTGNVSGTFRMLYWDSYNGAVAHSILNNEASPYGLLTRIYGNGTVSLQSQREVTTTEYFPLCFNPLGGNVAIGSTTASAKLHVHGDAIINTLHITTNEINGVNGTGNAHINYSSIGKVTIANGGGNVAIGGTAASEKLHVHGNLLTTGGITMYSQRSLKNILSYEGLSLEQLSVIKPIKFTWKDGRDNRYHVGGVADDVATVVPEVVYSANDFLTMDYGNAGFYVAASLIKPVINHETRIEQLENRVKELENENKQLKQAS